MNLLTKILEKHNSFRGRTGITPDSSGSHRVVYPTSDGGAGMRRRMRVGWIFVACIAAAAVFVLVLLLRPPKDTSAGAAEKPSTAVSSASGGSAAGGSFSSREEPPITDFAITRIDCDFTPPSELTFGVLAPVDLSGLSADITANVRAAGWGEVICTVSGDGSLLISAVDPPLFTAADYEAQKDFLNSSQPESFSRTFLQDSGIIPALRSLGFSLSTNVRNQNGRITFTGTGSTAQSACSISFSFLHTGAFNQARLSAETVTSNFATSDVLPLQKAAARAVTWTAPRSGDATVTEVEIRSIRGLPFYVFTLSDGGEAYALAITEDALSQSAEAVSVYRELMHSGISEYSTVSGGE